MASASPLEAPSIQLNNGQHMPVIALGTYLGFEQTGIVKPKDKELRDLVKHAIEIGWRHIDTAAVYATEAEVGEAVRQKIEDGTVTRKDIFITTKLWNTHHKREQVSEALNHSLKELGLDYVDLYLIHWPMGFNEDSSYSDVDFMETWRGMEDVVRSGLAKSIGVSNFNKEQLKRVLREGNMKPVALQIEVHPQLTQKELVDYAQHEGLVVMGYSPFGTLVSRYGMQLPGPKIDDPKLLEIANSYEKTTPQVVLRWLVDRNIVPLPKTLNYKRLEENLKIFDFKLEKCEMNVINSFDKHLRLTLPSFWQNHKYYPFEQVENPIPDPFSKVTIDRRVAESEVPTIKLNSGQNMPAIALGTYLGVDEHGIAKPKHKELKEVVRRAIDHGWRHFDTASIYGTEEEIGEGVWSKIAEGVVRRDEIFITTKLWNDHHKREEVPGALRDSLKRLGMNYVDLYLIHWPMAINEDNTYSEVDFMETWRGMEDSVRLGLAKSIGVSNFNKEQLKRVLREGNMKPTALQIEVHPQLVQNELVDYAQDNGLVVMAYSPFGSLVTRQGIEFPGLKSDDPNLVGIANKYKKTTPQIVLRWLVDRHIVPLPKTLNHKRLEENINIFDFQLDKKEMEDISAYDKHERLSVPSIWQLHKYYPFEKQETPASV